MKIILDPSRDGCTIWFPERNTLKFIHGCPVDICERIYNFSTYYDNDDYKVVQIIAIVLDNKGIGYSYQEILERKYKLKLEIIKLETELAL